MIERDWPMDRRDLQCPSNRFESATTCLASTTGPPVVFFVSLASLALAHLFEVSVGHISFRF